ncbi:hypothetical protein N7499_012076 [Penicillium canescens]|nr:hypothetical protein N7522_007595 [Penicillium canescens]KAJ6066002.1 hypothetical protein N7499_012076 [Penicillium canescens]KAJ6175326.1 hypothetical protein N7485_002240 [Penicillium canescens]
MVQYKHLACLLVPSLMMINWRASHSRRVSTKIPESVDQNVIIRALHDQPSFIKLNPVVIDVNQVPTDPATYEVELFQTSKTWDPIETYMLSSMITIIPWIGPWGQKHIQFGTWLRNTESGIKTYADAPFGVSVRSQWMVQPDTTRGAEGRNSGSIFGIFNAHRDSGWMLVVERTVECVWWLMPFVAYTYDGVHASVGRDLVELAGVKGA